MWGIYLDALRERTRGLRPSQEEIAARIEKGNPELHLLDRAEREALHTSASTAFGPGTAVKGAAYARYYGESQLALVELAGPIYRRADSMDTSGAQSTGQLMSTLRALGTGRVTTRELKRDSDGYPVGYDDKPDQPVSKALFTIDGPGGEATQIDEAAKLIHNMGQNGIMTVGFGEGLVASAHYYLASAMRFLFGSAMSLSGSIGVVMGVPVPAAKDAEGRNVVETPSGRMYVEFVNSESDMKRADPTTEKGMAYYQNLVDSSAAIFIADVARYRGINQAAATEQLGHGRVFDAIEAQTRNLIDDIGTFDEVFTALADGSFTSLGHAMTGAFGAGVLEAHSDGHNDGGTNTMSLKDKIAAARAAFSASGQPAAAQAGEAPAAGTTTGAAASAAAAAPVPPPTMEGLLKQLADQRPALEERFEAEAALFASKLRSARKIFPEAEERVAYAWLTARCDDAQVGGKVLFCQRDPNNPAQFIEVEGTRVQQVENFYADATPHSLADESIAAVREGRTQAYALDANAPAPRTSAGAAAGQQPKNDSNDLGAEMKDEDIYRTTAAGQRVLDRKQAASTGQNSRAVN